jgi:hypothetical protein
MAVQDGDHSDKHYLCPNPHIYMEDDKIVEGERYAYQVETTLKDKYGKLIYVGDIIWSSDDEQHYEVVFYKGIFAIYVPSDGTFSPLKDYLFDGAVAGNIFQNVNLIDKKYAETETT